MYDFFLPFFLEIFAYVSLKPKDVVWLVGFLQLNHYQFIRAVGQFNGCRKIAVEQPDVVASFWILDLRIILFNLLFRLSKGFHLHILDFFVDEGGEHDLRTFWVLHQILVYHIINWVGYDDVFAVVFYMCCPIHFSGIVSCVCANLQSFFFHFFR